MSGDNWVDPGIDTAAEARHFQDQLAAYDRDLADPATPESKKAIIAKQRASLARAIPYQLAKFAEIDQQRARTAQMAQNGLTRNRGPR